MALSSGIFPKCSDGGDTIDLCFLRYLTFQNHAAARVGRPRRLCRLEAISEA